MQNNIFINGHANLNPSSPSFQETSRAPAKGRRAPGLKMLTKIIFV